MEIGADGVLANTAISRAGSAKDMAYGMTLGVLAGRLGYLAGKAQIGNIANPSSTTVGLSK